MDSSLQIPGYSIQAEIGQGGMATVYVAIQESLARTVALKIMSSQSMADSSAEERFLKEGKIVARLSHPNIVTIYDIGRVEAVYYMAMEYIEGGNLNDRIRQGVSVADTYHIARQIGKALAYAHNRGFVHRDVKPANILFRGDGTAVLSDFGIAKAISSETQQLTAIGQTIGTPDYMSPEQVKGEPLDSRSDLYSLGLVIYETLTGEKPFISDSPLGVAMKHIVAVPPRLPEHLVIYQPLLDRLLAKEPSERFSTAEQLIRTLDDLIGDINRADNSATVLMDQSGPVGRSSTERTSLVGTRLRGRKMFLTVSLVALLLAGGGGYYWQSQHRADPQTRMIINMLLTEAEQQMQDSNLLEPPGVSAYQYYRNALELDPSNKQALEGIDKIAEHFETRARSLQQQEKYDEALASLEQGLEVKPKQPALQALHERLMAQRDEQRRRRKVVAFLEQATRQVEAGRLLAPPGNNAHDSYRNILELDPENKQARSGIREIANHIEEKAIAARKQHLMDQALALLKQGLQAFPQHAGLLEQLTVINRQNKIAHLLAEAERQVKASQWLKPAKDNATASYRKVLAIDPENAAAQSGLTQIAEHFAGIARQHRDEGALQLGLVAAAQGLKVQPDHQGLQALRTEIQQLEDRRVKQEQRERTEIQSLLNRAKRQHAGGKLAEPNGDNAVETLQAVLRLKPENREALTGLDAIADHYKKASSRAASEGRLQDALSAITLGFKAVPGHRGLQALKENVDRQLQETNRRERQLSNLLAAAQTHVVASRLIQPKGSNAYETYRKVLALFPNDPRALAGIKDIAEQLFQRGQRALEKGALKESKNLIDQGLRVASSHTSLVALRDKLVALRDEVTRRLEAQRGHRELNELLARADRQMAALKLTRPRGDSAYESYTRALEISPEDERAQAGLRHIADRYLELGRAGLEKGALQDSLAMIERGLEVNPDHGGLASLKIEVQRKVEAQRDEVKRLLILAQQHVKAGRLVEKTGDDARKSYLRVLKIDPDNKEATDGLRQIAAHYETLARKNRDTEAYREAMVMVDVGLKADPTHQALKMLQTELLAILGEVEDQNQQLAGMLADAQKKLEAGQFVHPEGDNAFEIYQEVLRLQPENPLAIGGLRSMAGHFEMMAREKQHQGDLQQSLVLVEKGLKILPGHAGLLSLQSSLSRQISRESEQIEEEAQPRKRRMFGTF